MVKGGGFPYVIADRQRVDVVPEAVVGLIVFEAFGVTDVTSNLGWHLLDAGPTQPCASSNRGG